MIKKVIYILTLIIFCTNFAFGETRQAGINYDGYLYTFRQGDETKFLKNANISLLLFEKSQIQSDKNFYLQEAMRYYFLLSQINHASIDAHIGLGRVYDEMNLDKYAKEHFYIALNLNKLNPKTNYNFANFHYKRNDLITALYFYKIAHKYGYSNDYELNYRLGTIYEKLADIENSKSFYKNSLRFRPQNQELANKIRLLDELNYAQSQYYLIKK